MLPDSPRDRLEWAITESLIVAGILLFWVGVAAAVTVVTSLLALPFRALGSPIPLPFVGFSNGLWAAVVPITVVTASLYVLVRAGELLIDYYRQTARQRRASDSRPSRNKG